MTPTTYGAVAHPVVLPENQQNPYKKGLFFLGGKGDFFLFCAFVFSVVYPIEVCLPVCRKKGNLLVEPVFRVEPIDSFSMCCVEANIIF